MAVADNDSCFTRWCCHPVDNNGNYVRLWDELICLLNFESRFIYSVLQMLACSFMVFGSKQLSQYFNEANLFSRDIQHCASFGIQNDKLIFLNVFKI